MFKGMGGVAQSPELAKRVGFTLFMLTVYRVGVQIPTPGIDTAALASFFAKAKGTLFGLFDMFSGGALENLSIFALGIMPYISASIILQLLTVAIPHLEALKKEGDSGRKKISQYTRYATVAISVVQGIGIAIGLESMTAPDGVPVVADPGWPFRLLTSITLMSGTMFIMWLGEQITERGIGNGISMIIFAGIVARMPSAIGNTFKLVSTGDMSPILLVFMLIMMCCVIGFICFMERANRRIPIHYAKRVIGRKVYGGQTAHLPLKINTSGVIPPIFASSLIMFPATIVHFIQVPWMRYVSDVLQPGGLVYELLFIGLIVFFCYFYAAITFNPVEIAENLKKNGGYIPGIRPGRKTVELIDRILTRIILIGAVYISAICVLPSILIANFNVPFYFGGTALLIVVGVAMDTMAQLESHLITRNYEGFMKGVRLKGRKDY